MAKKSGFIKDFREFISKGNVVDMAVGVIIGGAFGKIVTSLVDDVIMPAIGALIGDINFSDLAIVLKAATEDTKAVTINYGNFINVVINFLIIALCIFSVIRAFSRLREKAQALRKKEEEAAPEAPAEPSVEEKTLAALEDIKEILKNGKNA